MAYNRLPSDLADTLRKYGLEVEVVPGYSSRGRPPSTGDFDPVGVLCHDTVTPKSWSDERVVDLLVHGRPDLPGPLSQIGLNRKGKVFLVASGRANHAGAAKSSGTVASGDGNELYIGIEAFNNGVDEPWPDVQMNAFVIVCAVLSIEITKNSVNTVRGHKETSVTGKVDPTFNMNSFRTRVAAKMAEFQTPVELTRGRNIDKAINYITAAMRATNNSARLKKLKTARDALRSLSQYPKT